MMTFRIFVMFVHIQYTMLVGCPPFLGQPSNNSAQDIMRRIKMGDYEKSSPLWSGISEDAKNIIRGKFMFILSIL